MATPWYSNTFTGVAGQTARAEDVNTQFSAIQAGLAVAQAQVGQCIQVPGTDPALNVLPAAGSRVGKWMKFDSSGQPIIVNSPFNIRGAWSSNTVYNVGDAFTAAPNGSLYYVVTGYTSGASFGATDLANTTIIVNLTGLVLESYNQVYTGPQTINAVDGGSYALDCSAGAIVLNLPTETQLGNSPINVMYAGGTLTGSQTITVNAASGQFIMGNTQNQMNVDVVNFAFTAAWLGGSYGWRLRTMG